MIWHDVECAVYAVDLPLWEELAAEWPRAPARPRLRHRPRGAAPGGAPPRRDRARLRPRARRRPVGARTRARAARPRRRGRRPHVRPRPRVRARDRADAGRAAHGRRRGPGRPPALRAPPPALGIRLCGRAGRSVRGHPGGRGAAAAARRARGGRLGLLEHARGGARRWRRHADRACAPGGVARPASSPSRPASCGSTASPPPSSRRRPARLGFRALERRGVPETDGYVGSTVVVLEAV